MCTGYKGKQIVLLSHINEGNDRVPATAKNDQLHTSTCSVAVLPEQRDIQVKLLVILPLLFHEPDKI